MGILIKGGIKMEKQTKKFELIDVWYLEPKTLTEAKKWIGRKSLNELEVGYSITYQGMGHPVRFSIKRVR